MEFNPIEGLYSFVPYLILYFASGAQHKSEPDSEPRSFRSLK